MTILSTIMQYSFRSSAASSHDLTPVSNMYHLKTRIPWKQSISGSCSANRKERRS
jgi:hypothetical protein